MIWYKALFSLKGRLNRQGFWIGVGINFVFLFIIANFGLNLTASQPLLFAPLFVSAYSLVAIIIKRLHDRNRSGIAVLMAFLPIVCYVVSLATEGIMAWLLGTLMPVFISTMLLIEWGFFLGNPEPNHYGEKGQSFSLKSL